jgi:tRNA G26 N,N-dimethylase Trm1
MALRDQEAKMQEEAAQQKREVITRLARDASVATEEVQVRSHAERAALLLKLRAGDRIDLAAQMSQLASLYYECSRAVKSPEDIKTEAARFISEADRFC